MINKQMYSDKKIFSCAIVSHKRFSFFFIARRGRLLLVLSRVMTKSIFNGRLVSNVDKEE
jgi:hypothetical protein